MSLHEWPVDDGCVFGPWQHQTGLPLPTQYRVCVHPGCRRIERRDTPKA